MKKNISVGSFTSKSERKKQAIQKLQNAEGMLPKREGTLKWSPAGETGQWRVIATPEELMSAVSPATSDSQKKSWSWSRAQQASAPQLTLHWKKSFPK